MLQSGKKTKNKALGTIRLQNTSRKLRLMAKKMKGHEHIGEVIQSTISYRDRPLSQLEMVTEIQCHLHTQHTAARMNVTRS